MFAKVKVAGEIVAPVIDRWRHCLRDATGESGKWCPEDAPHPHGALCAKLHPRPVELKLSFYFSLLNRVE